METCTAYKVGNILYIDAPKKKFLPSYVYYLVQSKECTFACFGSRTLYHLDDMKGKESWKDVNKSRKEKTK